MVNTFIHAYAAVSEIRPEKALYCTRVSPLRTAAQFFIKNFIGDVLYAIKTNPNPQILQYLYKYGIRKFDVASIEEIELIYSLFKDKSDVSSYYMHPVKSKESIKLAYFKYGIRDFALDNIQELYKIIEIIPKFDDVNLYVRFATPNHKVKLDLSQKFGVKMDEEAIYLLQVARKYCQKLGVAFHVGSQCIDATIYEEKLVEIVKFIAKSKVKVEIIDVGGGFPAKYKIDDDFSANACLKTIRDTYEKYQKLFLNYQFLCEPGRALVADSGSTIVKILLRKGNNLYINDGIYGSLYDAGSLGFIYPVRKVQPINRDVAKEIALNGQYDLNLEPFSFYGPTCDSMDYMKGPFMLPKDIKEGDYIEIGQLGAYGTVFRTNFNGFYSDQFVELLDLPILSSID